MISVNNAKKLVLTIILLTTFNIASSTTINGYLCNDYPSSAGCGPGTAVCPNGIGGCAVPIYYDENPWQLSHELSFMSGESKSFLTGWCWEVYECNIPTTTCSCSDWVYQSCNGWDCNIDQIHKTRDCYPDSCMIENGCEYRPDCSYSAPEPPACLPNNYYSCYGGNLYWFDSCGSPTSVKNYCAYGCSNNACNQEPIISCSTTCQEGWTCFRDSCYKILGRADWASSKINCESVNAHLVTINDAVENSFVAGLNSDQLWIGINDLLVEGSFNWVSGSSSFTNWGMDEPNNADNNEDCVHINWGPALWNDINCNNGYMPVCEKSYPIIINRVYSFTAFNGPEESALNDFLGIQPAGSDLNTYLSGLSNQDLLAWEAYWVPKWVAINAPNTNELISFTQAKRAEFFDACTSNASTTCSNGSVFWVDSCGELEGLKESCGDFDACTLDACSDGACTHIVITPCAGNGVCESGENYCNSIDCSYSCGACQAVSCVGGTPNCQYLTDCCGNNICEAGEDCASCPGDCLCALSIDLSSVECLVNGESCAVRTINDFDLINAQFNLLNSSDHSVSVSFRTGSGLVLGSVITQSNQVSHSFSLPAGWQNVLISANDNVDGDHAEALIFSLNVQGNTSNTNSFVNYPFDYEAGRQSSNNDAPSGYSSGSELFMTGLLSSLIAGAGAIVLIKTRQLSGGTYVPDNPAAFLREYASSSDLSESVFNGLAGIRKDDTSKFIDNLKLFFGFGQFLWLGLSLTPLAPITVPLTVIFATIDNIFDIGEFSTNAYGAVKSSGNEDKSDFWQYVVNSGIAAFAVVPLVGDLFQDGRRAGKALGLISDALAESKSVIKLSEVNVNKLLDIISSLKKADLHEELIKKIVKNLDDDCFDIGSQVIKRLDNIPFKVDISDLGKLGKKEFEAMDDIIKVTEESKKMLQKITNKYDVDLPSTINIKKTLSDDALGFNYGNGLIELNFNKLVKKGSESIYEVVTHEFLHQITWKFDKEIKTILGESLKKYLTRNGLDVGLNEAHDVMVAALAKNIDGLDYNKFLKSMNDRLEKPLSEVMNTILYGPTEGNINNILDLLNKGEAIPALAEKIILEGGDKASKTFKAIDKLQDNILDLKQTDITKGILDKINELFNLKSKYEEVIKLV
ncbi:MAG: C-type lectin domain-containing protein [Candidatus Nanoarchaeia archaeon]|jgi:hypothetical protein